MKAGTVLALIIVILGIGIFAWYNFGTKPVPVSPQNAQDVYVENYKAQDSSDWQIFKGLANSTLNPNQYYGVYWWTNATPPSGTYNRTPDGKIWILSDSSTELSIVTAWIDSHPVDQM